MNIFLISVKRKRITQLLAAIEEHARYHDFRYASLGFLALSPLVLHFLQEVCTKCVHGKFFVGGTCMQGKITKAAVDALKSGDILADTEIRGFVARCLPSRNRLVWPPLPSGRQTALARLGAARSPHA